MDAVNFILNLAGLWLWLRWRAQRAARSASPSSTASARGAGPGSAKGSWLWPAVLVGLLLLRAVFYWQIGSAAWWTAPLNLGVIELSFRSDLFSRMLLFSFCSFGLALATLYLWLMLFSIFSGPEPVQRWVRLPLGRVDRWPRWLKILLPPVVAAWLWWLASWLFTGLHLIPPPVTEWRRLGQALVIGLESYLTWAYPVAALLLLHWLNRYVYFGSHPFWNYTDTAAQTLLAPLKKIPLRAGRADFKPIAGIALVFLVAGAVQAALTKLYGAVIR